jgi:hypothetical protein
MTSETDWSLDYCLYCDKQTLGGLYCSQTCRLADLENSESTPTSPGLAVESDSLWGINAASFDFQSSKSSRQFDLPPPFNFDKYRSSNSSKLESPPLSPRSPGAGSQQTEPLKPTRPTPTYRSNSAYPQTSKRSLNPSSSRSSLSSFTSTGSTQGLSEQAISQLQNYSNSFDHTRDWKRRVTLT